MAEPTWLGWNKQFFPDRWWQHRPKSKPINLNSSTKRRKSITDLWLLGDGMNLGGGNSNIFTPGEIFSNLTVAYFSDWLVQPPTRNSLWNQRSSLAIFLIGAVDSWSQTWTYSLVLPFLSQLVGQWPVQHDWSLQYIVNRLRVSSSPSFCFRQDGPELLFLSMNLPWTYQINNKPDMKATLSLFSNNPGRGYHGPFGD